MKKVLHIITRLEQGGTLSYMQGLLSGLSGKYEQVLVLGRKTTDIYEVNKLAKRCGVKVIYLDELVREVNIVKDPKAYMKLVRIIKEENPDIVHTHTSKAGFLGRLAAKKSGIKKIIHTPHGHIFYGYFGFIKTRLFILLERIAAKRCNKIIVFSKAEKKDHLDNKIGVPGSFAVIASGIIISKYKANKRNVERIKKDNKIGAQTNVVSMIGRLTKVKGQEYFLSAVPEILKKEKDFKVLVAGSGEDFGKLRELCGKLSIKKSVSFLGARKDIPDIIEASDVVAVPSLNEAFGIVIAEAGAMGKAVVASAVGGISEIVKDKKTGFLVKAKNAEVLAEKTLLLLRNRNLRNRMGAAARKIVTEFFTFDRVAREHTELYENL